MNKETEKEKQNNRINSFKIWLKNRRKFRSYTNRKNEKNNFSKNEMPKIKMRTKTSDRETVVLNKSTTIHVNFLELRTKKNKIVAREFYLELK